VEAKFVLESDYYGQGYGGKDHTMRAPEELGEHVKLAESNPGRPSHISADPTPAPPLLREQKRWKKTNRKAGRRKR
jgi:hypothetical protein